MCFLWIWFLCWRSSAGQSVTSLGKFKVDNPAFATLYENVNVTSPLDRYDLLLSTFSAIPFSTDTVQIVRGVGNYVKDVANVKATTLTTHTTWPNEVAGVPGMVNKRTYTYMVTIQYSTLLH